MCRTSVAVAITCLLCFIGFDVLGAPPAPIYRCELHGERVFSDRPCDGAVQEVPLNSERVSVYQPPASTSHVAAAQRRKVVRNSVFKERTDPVDTAREACEKMAQSIEWIHSKQRAGYKAKEGERLNERLRRLEEERRRKRCTH